ncbi:MAG: LLM class flavin-dependent oxidoreductase [Betaproteobacteria bacterium]|nr:LLM class flavin-dependent oxidoreductase [Betaproteobacteria bacterium]
MYGFNGLRAKSDGLLEKDNPVPHAISSAPRGALCLSISSDGRDDPPGMFGTKVAAGEAGGASQIWLANHLFQRDPVARASHALGATARLRAALMAVNPFTVHPVQAAMGAATLDEFYPGRVTLCLGSGSPGDLDTLGIPTAKPLKPMREALEITRALLSGEKVCYAGETFRVQDRSLATGQRRVPIFLAASRPRMLEVAGAHADGVLISGGSSVEFVRWCIDHVRRGAAGRTVRTSGLVYAAVDPDRAAVARLRRLLAMLLRHPHHRTNMDVAGTRVDQESLRAAVTRGDWPAAEALMTDDIVKRHAVVGGADEVRARLAEYHAAGLDEVVFAATRDGDTIAALLKAAQPGRT